MACRVRIASSNEFAVAQTLSEVASKREVLVTATVTSLAVVVQGIRERF
jgi:hypothetical protein